MSHIPVRVSTLRGDQSISFDAFIKINERFVMYVKEGDSFEGSRLERLKEKKIKKLWIKPDEEKKYRDYIQRNIEMAYDPASNKPIETRSEIIQGAQESNAEEVMENPESLEAYSTAKDHAGRFVEFLQKQDTAIAHILNIKNVEQTIAHHGVAVSTLSVALAKRLGITDPKQTQLLSLGALLHDIEHIYSGLKVNRPMYQFSMEELEKYRLHPNDGANRVKDKQHFDQAVINIIQQHEEFIDGHGFPNGLLGKDMDPLAVIVSSCNALDRLITFEGVPKEHAAKKLTMDHAGRHPEDHLKLLSIIINATL